MASMQLKRSSMVTTTASQAGFHKHSPREILRRRTEAYVRDYYNTYFNSPDDLIYSYKDDASITTNCQDVDKSKLGSRLTTAKVNPTKFEIKALNAVPVDRDDYVGDAIVTVVGNVAGGGSSYLCNQVLHLTPDRASGDYKIVDDMLLQFA
ncbi:hypothetical protein C5167_003575 [Papaver somniferum]|uniref:NTF2 domain-containing protein n=1 Tax=Papaver somniferum TaxID=3469 RepID=A0A4Y7L5B1_PAPSO|nr:uncharacterized protein LOC113313817 [Papaver somniferum]RZC79365.1 hypothetical protein C5167_003575 [Papaver somniferum]